MTGTTSETFTVFDGPKQLASGPLHEIARAIKRAEPSVTGPILIFGDATGRPIDLDLRGTEDEALARLPNRAAADTPQEAPPAAEPRGRGRPKLGVVAREVTLLPRHWDWLSAQPGGASVALRKLVEQARRTGPAAYHFMSVMAGNLPGFEEASRALFADDRRRLTELIASWPPDIRDHVVRLAFGDRA